MRDAVSESKCSRYGRSGQFPFKKETESQIGILKLEFISFEFKKLFSNYLGTAKLFLPVGNQSAI